MADVELIVEGKHLPAHSQCLANKSVMIHKMLEDCPSFSKQQPAVIKSVLNGYTLADVQVLLKYIYSNLQISTAPEAMQLLTASDHFDCPGLTQCAVQYLEVSNNVCLMKSGDKSGALYWVQIAHQFNLSSLIKRCVKFLVTHFQLFQSDPQLQHLPPAIYLKLLQQQREALQRHTPAKHWSSIEVAQEQLRRAGDCGCNACNPLRCL